MNLLVTNITDDGSASTTLGFLRYRTPAFNPALINLTPQYAIAQDLLGKKAKPDFLDAKHVSEGSREQEVLFRLYSSPGESTLQMRYATPHQIEAFLQNAKSQPVITGKLQSGMHILSRFLPILGTDAEFERTHFQRKSEATRAFERFKPRFKAALSPTPFQMSERRTA